MNQTPEVPDITLMMRVRGGDVTAFELLHERYQRKLLNFFYGMSHHAPTAGDLCQETFLRVWQVRRRYRASGAFPAYLFGIARMVWREYCRSRAKEWRFHDNADWASHHEPRVAATLAPDYLAMCGEAEGCILEALQNLSEEQRMVFVMRSIRGLSLADIAAAMDCPVNTVRSRKILGMKRLRHLLERVFYQHEDRVFEEDRKK